MSKKLDLQKWLKDFTIRTWNLSQQKPVVVREDNNTIFEFDIGQLLTISNGKLTIELGQLGLKTKGNLIGMGGCYYNPELFWGETVEKVVLSWDWLIEKMGVDPKTFQTVVEFGAIIEFLIRGGEEGLLFYLLSLTVDLHELHSMDVDITAKISELGKQARAHLKKYEKLKNKDKAQSLFRITALRRYMANLSSECRLARLAKEFGYEVKLGKHPDLTINGRGIEVKRVSITRRIVNLSSPIEKALKQDADAIAIQVDDLKKRAIKGFKTVWTGTDRLRNVLPSALAYEKKGRCVLLFCGTNRGYFARIILLKKRLRGS